jgi:hypothetical protein
MVYEAADLLALNEGQRVSHVYLRFPCLVFLRLARRRLRTWAVTEKAKRLLFLRLRPETDPGVFVAAA